MFILKISGALGLILLIVSGIVYNNKGFNTFVRVSLPFAMVFCGLHILFHLLPIVIRLIFNLLLKQ